MQEFLEQTRIELRLRNYSPKTINSYLGCLRDFFLFLSVDFEVLNLVKVKQFLLLKQDKHYSPQTINLYLHAIKFFYHDVLKNYQKIDLKFAKKNNQLPEVLSKEEIKKILSQITNKKHLLMLSLAYGAGLRVSEVIDLKIKDIRGNVDTRLRKLDDPDQGYDAILLAQAGLERLGRTALEFAHPLPYHLVLPAPGQGALGVQGRADDVATIHYLQALEHAPTRAAVTAERSFLAGLGGGCSLPVGALGMVVNNTVLELQGVVASPDGRRVIRVSGGAEIESGRRLGQKLAAEALARGAADLLS